MWYLWLQIIFLLLLAALCGAGLAYWWLRGRYEDVTESYTALSEREQPVFSGLTTSDLDERLAVFDQRFEQLGSLGFAPLRQQLTDLGNAMPTDTGDTDILRADIKEVADQIQRSAGDQSDLVERLSAIEAALAGIASGQGEFDALGQKLQDMETELPKLIHSAAPETEQVDLQPVHSQLSAIESRLDAMETIGPQLAKLSENSTQLGPALLSPLKSDLLGLSEKLAGLQNTDVAPVQLEVKALRDRISGIAEAIEHLGSQVQTLDKKVMASEHNFGPINEKLADISSRTVSNSGNYNALAALDQKIGGFETTIVAIKQRMDQIGGLLMTLDKRVDATVTNTKIDETMAAVASLRPALSGLESLDPMEKGLAHLREMVFNLRERDLSSLNLAVRSIESNVDFAGVENRLTSIEYGLAATHHMLRSRLERSTELPPSPQRTPFGAPPRDMAYTPPAAPRVPEAPVDPLDIIRIPGEPGELLLEAGFGAADDLEKIRGIGPMLRQLLNDIGVFYYWQIASWDNSEVAMIDEKLPGYHGRISRDQWVKQAAVLMKLPTSAQRPLPFAHDE
ncbi:MAG: hypothetical protein AAF768_03610 [Pseudomonadota bacterium]